LARDRHNAIAYKNRGNARTRLADFRGAIADYSQAIAELPTYAFAIITGDREGSSGRLRGVIEDYSRAIELRPSYALAYKNRGMLIAKKGGIPSLIRAIQDFDKATSIDPTFRDAYIKSGYYHFLLGDYQTAAGRYSHAIRLNPGRPRLLHESRPRLPEAVSVQGRHFRLHSVPTTRPNEYGSLPKSRLRQRTEW
jgi:tetratricopeptide (TPR) repeat protein